MSDPFIGQILMFGGNFAPRSWALCDGQLLSIASNTALFSILGTIYGGDGRTTFGLPDLRGRLALHTGGNSGTGPGLPTYRIGQRGGANNATMTALTMPSHNHVYTPKCNTDPGNNPDPEDNFPANAGATLHYSSGQDDVGGQNTTAATGNGQAFSITQPGLGVYYIICLQGRFPSRN